MKHSFKYHKSLYEYWFDEHNFGFSWIKGAQQYSDSAALSELGSEIDTWVGRPQSTQKKLKTIFILLPLISGTLIIANPWVQVISMAFFILYASYVAYSELGFIKKNEFAVVTFIDNADYCYILRTHEIDQDNFFNALSKRIEESAINKT